MVNVTDPRDARIPPAEVPDVHPPHPHGWIGKWVFSQDAKYIAIQYAGTAIAIGLVALVLSADRPRRVYLRLKRRIDIATATALGALGLRLRYAVGFRVDERLGLRW